MKLKHIAAAVALMASGSAFAGATGNVGAFSEYMFRGVVQTGGAAVQGGVDYAHDSGLYVGTWASNVGFAGAGGGTELDVYGGFSGKAGEIGYDVGAIYYYYPEEDEVAVPESFNTLEFYVGGTFGPVGLKGFWTDEYFGTEESALYVNATLNWPLSETLAFTANLGYSDGDGIEVAYGEDNYIDYSIGLAKTLDAGFVASFQIIDSDLEAAGVDDDPKPLLGLKKTFNL